MVWVYIRGGHSLEAYELVFFLQYQSISGWTFNVHNYTYRFVMLLPIEGYVLVHLGLCP
jgi:hypothetical protein